MTPLVDRFVRWLRVKVVLFLVVFLSYAEDYLLEGGSEGRRGTLNATSAMGWFSYWTRVCLFVRLIWSSLYFSRCVCERERERENVCVCVIEHGPVACSFK